MKRKKPNNKAAIMTVLLLLLACTNYNIEAKASGIYREGKESKQDIVKSSIEESFKLGKPAFETVYHSKATFNKKKAKKNISVTYKKLPDGILAIFKNKNSYSVSLTAVMQFKDADGKDIKSLKDYNYCLGAKSTCLIFFAAPFDGNGNSIDYNSYKSSFSVAKTKYKSYGEKINLSWDIQTVFSNFSATNTSEKELTNIHISILFYDSNGDLLGYRGKSLNCNAKDSTNIFSIEHSANWGGPAKLKVYVDYAY